jgi:H+/Cl- antiporter ClcA
MWHVFLSIRKQCPRHTQHFLDHNQRFAAYLVFAGFAVAYVMVAAVLVAYIEPVACGSGIPEMKGYLNGMQTCPRSPHALVVPLFGLSLCR